MSQGLTECNSIQCLQRLNSVIKTHSNVTLCSSYDWSKEPKHWVGFVLVSNNFIFHVLLEMFHFVMLLVTSVFHGTVVYSLVSVIPLLQPSWTQRLPRLTTCLRQTTSLRLCCLPRSPRPPRQSMLTWRKTASWRVWRLWDRHLRVNRTELWGWVGEGYMNVCRALLQN